MLNPNIILSLAIITICNACSSVRVSGNPVVSQVNRPNSPEVAVRQRPGPAVPKQPPASLPDTPVEANPMALSGESIMTAEVMIFWRDTGKFEGKGARIVPAGDTRMRELFD